MYPHHDPSETPEAAAGTEATVPAAPLTVSPMVALASTLVLEQRSTVSIGTLPLWGSNSKEKSSNDMYQREDTGPKSVVRQSVETKKKSDQSKVTGPGRVQGDATKIGRKCKAPRSRDGRLTKSKAAPSSKSKSSRPMETVPESRDTIPVRKDDSSNNDSSNNESMWMNDADSIDIRRSPPFLGVSTTAPKETLAVALEVEDSNQHLDQERAEFAQKVRQSILDEAVKAELMEVPKDSIKRDRESSESRKTALTKHVKMTFLATLLVIAIVLGSTLLLRSVYRDNTSGQVNNAPGDSIVTAPTPAPSPAIVYLSDGRQAFTSTGQLYDAVDAYVEASDANETESSDAAIQYGYPIGTWDVSRLSDFSRVFDVERDRPLDASINSKRAKMSTMNEDLSGWNVSRAVTMYGMFAGASSFVGDGLEEWDTSRVTDFSFMFYYANAFVGNLSTWDTSIATKMVSMFREAHYFDGDLAAWDVSNVDSMAYMFFVALWFEGKGLSTWNVAKVRDMTSMFQNALSFIGNISSWDTGSVDQVVSMFTFAESFNGDLSHWQVGRVRNMNAMFIGASAFEGIGLSRWNVSRVQNLDEMFAQCPSLTADLSRWDVSQVTRFKTTFNLATKFSADLSKWNTSSAVVMQQMFGEAKAFSSDLSSWDTSRVESMNHMFLNAGAFNSNLANWNVSRVKDATRMFAGATSFNYSLCSWGQRLPSNGAVQDMFLNAVACETTSDPSSVNMSLGPFCHPCNSRRR